MTLKTVTGTLFAAALLAGCTGTTDYSTDQGLVDQDSELSTMVATIWVDPNGCQHWMIDDGAEGYMSPRLNRDGTPRCE